jgi:hypothetical protein
MYTSPLMAPCDVLRNPDMLAAPLGQGHLSVLVFATVITDAGVQPRPFLVGCSTHTLTSAEVSDANGASLFDVYLSLANPDSQPPATPGSCSGLTDFCANRCMQASGM